jgi:hypothetical protein
MWSLGRSLVVMAVVVAAPRDATAQNVQSSSRTTWNLDLAGTAGIKLGIGAATTGADLSGAVTVARSTEFDEFSHRCLGLTTMFSGVWSRSEPGMADARERSVLVGPRWDAGDLDGAAFVRILGGVRQVSGLRATSDGHVGFSETTGGVGAGFGVAVAGVLLDVNWVISPWADETPQRLTFGLGYIWSVPLK